MPEKSESLLSDEKFNDGLSMTAAWVVECLKGNDHDDFTPTLLVHTPPGDDGVTGVTIVVMPQFEVAKRFETIASVGAKFAHDRVAVAAIYFVSEVWISYAVDEGGLRRYARPEFDPDRIEAVNVAGLTYDGRAAQAEVLISRTKGDKIIAGQVNVHPYGGDVTTKAEICQAFFRGFVLGIMDAAQRSRP